MLVVADVMVVAVASEREREFLEIVSGIALTGPFDNLLVSGSRDSDIRNTGQLGDALFAEGEVSPVIIAGGRIAKMCNALA